VKVAKTSFTVFKMQVARNCTVKISGLLGGTINFACFEREYHFVK